MTQLNQIIAIEVGTRVRVDEAVKDALKRAHAQDLITGNVGTYEPLDPENGEQMPPERKDVQVKVEDVMHEVAGQLARLFDLAATKEQTDTVAFADVVVDGQPLLERVPATYLLFLDRELENLRQLVAGLPVLDAATWEDGGDGVYRTPESKQIKTKKLPRNHVLAWPTADHPNIIPQVQVYTEDLLVGHWTRRRLSGALHPRRRREVLDKIVVLQRSVKYAKEEANRTDVENRNLGQVIMAHLFD